MDGVALIQRDLTGCGVCKPHEGEVDGLGAAAAGETGGSSTGGNNRGPGWGGSVGTFGCPTGGPEADGLVKPGTEWLAAEPGRD